MTKGLRKLKIRSFEAIKDLGACLSFSEGYTQVLSDQGINSAYVNTYDWYSTQGVHGVLAEYEEDVVGGLLLFQPSEQKSVFPFKEIMGYSKGNMQFPIETLDQNYGELFALWHSGSAAGWGLSYILLKAGLALSVKLGIEKTFYLVADYNTRLADKLGLEPQTIGGINISYTMKVMSVEAKVHLYHFSPKEMLAMKRDIQPILELQKKGTITKLETVLGNRFEIEYHIK